MVTRIAAPGCCKWCTELAGEYLYAEVRRAGSDVWRRHANCGCRIEYEPGKDGRREDVLNYVIGKKERLHPDAERDRIEERKRLADSGQPSREELLRRAKAGRNDPNNQGYIAARILSGEYSMQYRHNKYVQHCKGTNLYEQITRARGKPQSYLTISEEEAQQIVWKYAGTGVIKTDETVCREMLSLLRQKQRLACTLTTARSSHPQELRLCIAKAALTFIR